MSKNIIREVSDPDFEFYFDGDMFSSAAGDFGYTLFIVTDYRCGYQHNYNSYLNKEDFKEVKDNCRYLFTEVEDLLSGDSDYKNVKEIMNDYNIPYCPKTAHRLKTLTEVYDNFEDPELIAKYLSIKTGKKWKTYNSKGCRQGDYATIVFCTDFYDEKNIEVISDIFWGMGKEFAIHFNDDDEDNFVYGYFIADCEYRSYEDIKTYFCNMEGFKEEETVLEVISGSHTVTHYDYETI